MADKFKVFLSWSGERSKLVARALREWLPFVLQSIEPWMSEQDIQVGQQWFDEVGKKLKDSGYGVFCITNENLNKPWILFEAGAIWKAFDGTYLSAYTFGLSPADIPGTHPLSQFKGTKADKDGTKKLIEGINNAMGSVRIDAAMLNKLFDKWWPDLKMVLEGIPDVQQEAGVRQPREEREILEDVLNTVRSLEQNLMFRAAESRRFMNDDEEFLSSNVALARKTLELQLPFDSIRGALNGIFAIHPRYSFDAFELLEAFKGIGLDISKNRLAQHLNVLAQKGQIESFSFRGMTRWRLRLKSNQEDKEEDKEGIGNLPMGD